MSTSEHKILFVKNAIFNVRHATTYHRFYYMWIIQYIIIFIILHSGGCDKIDISGVSKWYQFRISSTFMSVNRRPSPQQQQVRQNTVISTWSCSLMEKSDSGKLQKKYDPCIYWLIEAEWGIYALVNWPSLVQIMARRLAGAKPLFKPMLEYC